jgi:hypothetical protein
MCGVAPLTRLQIMNEPQIDMTNVTKKYGAVVAVHTVPRRHTATPSRRQPMCRTLFAVGARPASPVDVIA